MKLTRKEKINQINDFIEFFKLIINKFDGHLDNPSGYFLKENIYFYYQKDIDQGFECITAHRKGRINNLINLNILKFNNDKNLLNCHINTFNIYYRNYLNLYFFLENEYEVFKLNQKLENKLIKKNVATKTIKI